VNEKERKALLNFAKEVLKMENVNLDDINSIREAAKKSDWKLVAVGIGEFSAADIIEFITSEESILSMDEQRVRNDIIEMFSWDMNQKLRELGL